MQLLAIIWICSLPWPLPFGIFHNGNCGTDFNLEFALLTIYNKFQLYFYMSLSFHFALCASCVLAIFLSFLPPFRQCVFVSISSLVLSGLVFTVNMRR